MEYSRRTHRRAGADRRRRAYELIVRGPDGRPRFEKFDSAAAYRARLTALERSDNGSLSIEEIATLLDT
jgi:hypothetical protein